jgi:pimeloyl-ACP methyl ester carboxylesterase
VPAGHRIVVLDLLGYGRSDRPLARPVDIRAHAERVVQVLDELRISRACVVGHGIGGGIAQSLAIRHAPRVSSLCLVDSVAFDRWPTIEGRLARATLPVTRFLPSSVLLTILRRDLRRGYGDPDRATRSLDLYLRPFASTDGRDALVSHIRALTSDETRELGSQLARIAAPTAIVWGQQDRAIPLWVGRQLQQAIPGASLDIVPGGRHFTPEEAPRHVSDAIAKLTAMTAHS